MVILSISNKNIKMDEEIHRIIFQREMREEESKINLIYDGTISTV
jgi:hypothetical protein